MGAEPYHYLTPYQHELSAVLEALRQSEFSAGHYRPVISRLRFPIGPHSPKPGAQHASIDEAREAAGATGTRSILDIDHISMEPALCGAMPVYDETLRHLFRTTQPNRKQVLSALPALFELVERGMCSFIVLFENGRESEVLFFGYSFD